MTDKPIYICVTPFFPTPSTWQGSYVLDQVKAIKRNSEYEVVVFRTLPLGSKEYTYEIEGVTVHAICPLLMPSYIFNGATECIVGRMFVRTLKRVGIDPMRVAYTHCHTINHSAFGYGVKHVNPNARVLVQFHDLDPLTLRNGLWAKELWNRRYRAKKSIRAINRADHLICISEPVKDVLLAFPKPRKAEIYESAIRMYSGLGDLPSLKPKSIYVLNNGVDTNLFNADSHNNTQAPDKKVFRIGCIANFQDLKGHITLVEAFKLLVHRGHTNMRLSLLGNGATRPIIEDYIKREGLVEYTEWPSEVFHNNLPEYYHTLHLFVLPSYYEGFGCVYTEAYACGVPFICCENQGAAELIEPKERERWITKAKDAQHLALLIEQYYSIGYKQNLCKPIDIDLLIRDYLKYIESK